MSPRYLFSCPSCQHANELITTQAGQEFQCAGCGESISAPRLGQLRLLPPAGGSESDSTQNFANGKKKGGGLFVFGLLLFLFCGVGGAGLYFYGSQKLVPYDVEKYLEKASGQIDGMSLNELVAVYSDLPPADKGLGPWKERPYVSSNKQGEILLTISYALMGVGALGILLMLAGLSR